MLLVNPLFLAIKYNQLKIVKFYYKKYKLDIEYLFHRNEYTVLQVCLILNNFSIRNYFLELGANVKHVNKLGQNYLMIAMKFDD